MNTSNRKHIALISVHGDPAIEIGKEEAGGQNVYVRQVGEALALLGWQVDMFTRKANAEQAAIVQHSSNCRTIRLVAGPEEFVPRDNIFPYAAEFVQQILKFQKDNGIKYALVHTNYWISAWVGMQLKKIQGSKQVHTYHSLGYVKYKSVPTVPLIAKKRLDVEKAVLETAESIVATSPQEKVHMRQLVSKQGNIDIIPCGTDIHRFGSVTRAQARQELDIDPESLVILYVGRFDPRKGIETLVRAVGQSQLRGKKDIKLIIGGGSRPGQSDGMERDRIESIVAELGMTDITVFPGRLGDETLHNYYAAADVCVVPSHYEPFGLVAIEAMASATPVIASDVGGLQFTVVPEETGLLAPAKDDAAFSQAIDRILSLSPEEREKMGVAARRRVEKLFSWEGVAVQLGDLYTDLMQPKKQLATVKQKEAVSA
ncbi:glycosyltransferase family 4 protein [Chlorogloea sp. CCALA 695]|uniref:glycosyltransferase family 4 protein n=1 Tax=Chlorogloea sp. CCALA 695 TaxID=2107693 RepID=UPI000D07D0F6|nr:glycosyltransferase family 1 protein [Chlorogloea sp. CCALA 695]PSB31985.1 glycoside hydrolase [Chlorogloea sp. CCALA 695]